ncbi:HAD family acid phosphatase [Streptomyces orinoci]|uniref:HAD family acid phosphatase n=1 Tax=Streptomyces orinoci TaxID=67339 RepID=A0ABV3JZP0_STRON|nr:HAD family acid phosphatase [Streptomyces orinoci]
MSAAKTVKYRRLAVLAALAAASLSTAATAQAAPEQGAPSYQTWQSDVRKAIAPAIPWLSKRIGAGAEQGEDAGKPAIVLDIDNTSLETYYHPGQANKPVLSVAQWAHRHGMAVLFVTARTSSSSARQQLTDAGYPVDAICTRDHGESKDEGKERCREELTEDGYTITANIGNRATDFAGGYYEKGFKLPDYNGRLS